MRAMHGVTITTRGHAVIHSSPRRFLKIVPQFFFLISTLIFLTMKAIMILDTHGRNFYLKIIDMITKYKIKRVDQSDLLTQLHVCCSQFHQHFTNSFCVDMLSPKSQTVIREKLCKVCTANCKALLYENGARKILKKLTPGMNWKESDSSVLSWLILQYKPSKGKERKTG